jgi:serine/threonine protein kinase
VQVEWTGRKVTHLGPSALRPGSVSRTLGHLNSPDPVAVSTTVSTNSELEAIRGPLGERYVIERELGRGGMGTVYLARDVKLDRPVALKVLPAEFASQVALRDRFLQETRTAAKFSHPNIVPVYAVEDGGDFLAYAMGFVEGETLAERVKRAGPLPVREIVRMLQDVGYALAYAHGRNVVHRDIKPDNIMIERATGRALVMDFGISRSMTRTVHTAALTRIGEVVGTPEYMSPEQASGDVVDGRSDLYSLGLAAHFAATASTAMTAETTQKILVKQLTEQVPPIARLRPDLPSALAEAIDKCVQKDPAHRFATAEALVDAIDAAQLAPPDIPVPVRLFANELGMLSLVVLAIALYAVVFVNSNSDLSGLDIMIPLVGLSAVLITRALTSLAEAQRLAAAGFSVNDVMSGFQRVVDERAERRASLRADGMTWFRRRRTLAWAVVMLPLGIAMMVVAWFTRVEYAPNKHSTPIYGILLVYSGIALIGTSTVLLVKSPFRMPPGERFFRAFWLGPAGRAFVKFGMRKQSRGAGPSLRSGRQQQPEHTKSPAPPATAEARLKDLERRVSDLEQWKKRQ